MTITTSGDGNVSAGNFYAGVYYGGASTLVIDGEAGGLIATTANMQAGLGNGSNGAITLTGGTDPVNITVDGGNPGDSGTIIIGKFGGTGSLLVEAGATLTSNNQGYYYAPAQEVFGGYYNINIGRGNGATGTVTVTGAGSEMTATGLAPRITVGRQQGDGTLNVEDGANVGTLSVQIARQYGSTGTVTVTGAGSTLNVNDTYGIYDSYQGEDFSGRSGGINVGRQYGDATLNIYNGGSVIVQNTDGVTTNPFINVGRQGADGTVNIDGYGSSLIIDQNGAQAGRGGAFLGIGRAGDGDVNVSNNATLYVRGDDAFIAVGDDFGAAPASGGLSTLNVTSGGVVVVDSENGDNGGIGVAQEVNSRGAITIDGAASTVALIADGDGTGYAGFMNVGRRGDGSVTITNGGTLYINGGGDKFPGMNIGRGEDDGSVNARGSVVVTGAGSSVQIFGANTGGDAYAGFVAVGSRENSQGFLGVLDGGAFTMGGPDAQMVVGNRDGSEGSVVVSGTGSNITIAGDITIGNDGDGSLLMDYGGTITADTFTIGDGGEADMTGTLTANLNLDGFLEIGVDTVGALDVVGGFNMNASSALLIDIDDFDVGIGDSLTIDGDANFDTLRSFIALRINDQDTFDIGDTFTIATATGTMTAATRTIFDTTFGLQFTLSASGSDLILTADEANLGGGLILGDGNDNNLVGTADAELIQGLAGFDTLNGLGGDDTLEGGDDDDTLIGGEGADAMDGGDGQDAASYETASARVAADLAGTTATLGDAVGDTFAFIEDLIGSDFDDVLRGDTNANIIQGGDGADMILSRAGDDQLFGDAGNDTLCGNGGNDSLFGGIGDDNLMGDLNDDVLEGGVGADTLDGGSGTDTASYAGASSRVQADIGNGVAGVGDALGDVFTSIENLEGTRFNDVLRGNSGGNEIRGGNASDRLFGLGGNDTLIGENGADVIIGNAGKDVMTGEAGRDRFIYFNTAETRAGVNRDVITDFTQADNDRIEISRFDAVLGVGGNQAFTFIADAAFSNTAGELRFDQSSGVSTVVQGDQDGDSVADFEIELTGLITLDAGDFLL